MGTQRKGNERNYRLFRKCNILQRITREKIMTETLETKDQIQAFKLFGLWRFLKLEIETDLKMSRYGSAYKEVKNLTNWQGSKKKIYTVLSQYLACLEVITWEQMREARDFVGKDYFNSVRLEDFVEIV